MRIRFAVRRAIDDNTLQDYIDVTVTYSFTFMVEMSTRSHGVLALDDKLGRCAIGRSYRNRPDHILIRSSGMCRVATPQKILVNLTPGPDFDGKKKAVAREPAPVLKDNPWRAGVTVNRYPPKFVTPW